MKFYKTRVRPGQANHISFLLFLLSLFLQPVSADEVLINDGSRIMGEVMRHDTTVLKLKTSFLGTVEIEWAEIVEVTLTEPGIVLLRVGLNRCGSARRSQDSWRSASTGPMQCSYSTKASDSWTV